MVVGGEAEEEVGGDEGVEEAGCDEQGIKGRRFGLAEGRVGGEADLGGGGQWGGRAPWMWIRGGERACSFWLDTGAGDFVPRNAKSCCAVRPMGTECGC